MRTSSLWVILPLLACDPGPSDLVEPGDLDEIEAFATAPTNPLRVTSARASADDGNVAANAIDGRTATRWSADGDGQWIEIELATAARLEGLGLAWYRGDKRTTRYTVRVSQDGARFTDIGAFTSSGRTRSEERVLLSYDDVRVIRVIGHGNSQNGWNSLTELRAYGRANATAPSLDAGLPSIDAGFDDAGAPSVDAGAARACPSVGPARATGSVAIPALAELSGIAVGRLNPDVYWAHNDESVQLFAFDRQTHALRASYALVRSNGTAFGRGDVEDIAIRALPGGGAEIFLGDIGSGHPGSNLRVFRVTEPQLTPTRVEGTLIADVMEVRATRLPNAETLLVDPILGELVIVEKAARPSACALGAFIANAVVDPSCTVAVLGIANPSGGDVSPDGSAIVVRNEGLGLVWTRAPGTSLVDAFRAAACAVPSLSSPGDECNGEAIAFTPDGLGLVTASESVGCSRANVHAYTFAP